jgi:hypothetical protein
MKPRCTLVVALVAVAGCGSGDSQPQTDEDEVRGVVKNFAAAFVDENYDQVCSLMTSEAKADLLKAAAFVGTEGGGCAGVMKSIASFGDQSQIDDLRNLQIKSVSITGKTAIVHTTAEDSATQLTKKGDRWLVETEPDSTTADPERTTFDGAVARARAKVESAPQSAPAHTALVRALFQFASSTEGSDAKTGALTDKGQQAVKEVARAWETYLQLNPSPPDPAAASFAALAYGALQQYDKAVETQEVAVRGRPSANAYFQLADFAYRSGQVTAGDEAASEAVRRSPSDQRNTVRSLIKDLKKQGAQIAKAVKEQEKSQKPGQSYGPLPGTGGG